MKLSLLLSILLISIYCSGETINISCGPETNLYIQKAKTIIEQVYKYIGFDVDFNHTSFERAIINSSSGKTDGELFRFREVGDLYDSLHIVDEPLYYIGTNAYTSKTEVIITNWDDLSKYKIAFVRGIKSLQERFKGHEVIETNTHKEAFIHLKRGTVDFVISGNITAENIITEEDLQAYIKASFILEKKPVFHLVHESRIDLIPELESAIKTLNHNNGN